jgi:histone deacetylase 11
MHTVEYINQLDTKSSFVAGICELPPLAYLPHAIVESRVLRPSQYAVRGTMLAGQLALEYGFAINLGGGMHHASSAEGGKCA